MVILEIMGQLVNRHCPVIQKLTFQSYNCDMLSMYYKSSFSEYLFMDWALLPSRGSRVGVREKKNGNKSFYFTMWNKEQKNNFICCVMFLAVSEI